MSPLNKPPEEVAVTESPEDQIVPFEIDPIKYLASVRQSEGSIEQQIKELEKFHGIDTPEATPQAKEPRATESQEEEIARLESELGINKGPSLGDRYLEGVKKSFAYKEQLTGGAADAIQNTWNSIVDMADWGENYLATQGYGSGDLIKPGQFRGNLGEKLIPPSTSADEKIVRSIGNFVLPFAGWSKAFKLGSAATGAGNFVRGSLAGAATDFTAFDPTNGRLSDMIESVPSLRNPITGYLASNPKDSGAEGRFKQALEGILAGGVLSSLMGGVFFGVKALKNAAGAKDAARIISRGEQVLESQKVASELPVGADLPLSAETQAAQAVRPSPPENTLYPTPEGTTGYHGTKRSFESYDYSRSGGMQHFAKEEGTAAQYASGAGGNRGRTGIQNSFLVDHDTGVVYELRNPVIGKSQGIDKGQIIDGEFIPVGKQDPKEALISKENMIPLSPEEQSTIKPIGYEDFKANNVDDNNELIGSFDIQPKSARIIPQDLSGKKILDLKSPEGIKVLSQLDKNKAGKHAYLIDLANDAVKTGDDYQLKGNIWPATKYAKTKPLTGITDQLKELGYDGIHFRDDMHDTVSVFGSEAKAVSQGVEPAQSMTVKQVPGQGTMLDIINDVKATEVQAQKVVSGSPAGELAGNIKLEKYNITDQAKSVIAQADQVFNAEIGAARGAPINMADLQSLADESGLTIQKLMSVPEYQTLGKEGILKLREVVGTSAQLVFESAEKASIGSMADKAAFLHVLDVHKALQARLSGATAEWGRSGLAFKMDVGAADAATKSKILKEMLGSSGGESTVGEMADLLVKLGKNPAERARVLGKVLERSGFQKTKDALFEFYVNSLLSGPRTHITNFLSNTTAVITRVTESAGAAISGATRGAGSGEKVFFGEVGAQIHGMMEGMADGFQLAWKAVKTGRPTMDKLQKFETSFGDSIKELSEGNTSTLAQSLGPMSAFVSLPSRALMASDEFFKSIHYRASLRQQAVRQSERAGLTGKAFNDNVNNLLKDPNADMVLQGISDMREFTFTKQLTGGAQAVDKAIKSVPGMKVVMPFVRTNLNLLEFQIQRSPFAPLLKNVRADLAQGGIARDMAMSRMAVGSAAMATAAYYAGQGILTGSGPANIQARKLLEQTGWQPYSVYLDGKYYRYDKLDPFGGLLAMAADFSEIKEQLDDINPNDADELALASLGILADHLTPNFLIESMGSFANAVRDPQSRDGKQFISSFLSGLATPALARAATRYMDPTKRDVTADPRSPHPIFEGVVNNWKSAIPQYSKDLPPQLNLFGEPVVLGPGFGSDSFSPVYVTKEKHSPGIDELIRLEMAGKILKPEAKPGEAHFIVSMPPRQIDSAVGPVKLSAKKYQKYVTLSAGIGLNGFNETLKEALDRIVKEDFIELGPDNKNDEQRKIFLANTISGYRRAAAGQMKTEGDLEEGINHDLMRKVGERMKGLGMPESAIRGMGIQ